MVNAIRQTGSYFGLSDLLRSSHGLIENESHLDGSQGAERSCSQIVRQGEVSDAIPVQRQHVIARCRKHPAYLVVAAFGDRQRRLCRGMNLECGGEQRLWFPGG